MKYKGKKVEGRNVEIIPIIRPEENIIFIAEAVENYKEFDEMCPEPEPPVKLLKGGLKVSNPKDPIYLKQLDEYATQKTNYMLLRSLAPTVDLEWETVDLKNPETWKNWRKELEEAGFTEIELIQVLRGINKANSLDDDMIEQARQDFLAGQGEGEK